MGFSPPFLGGPGAYSPGKIFENQTLENAFPGILGLETLTLQGWIKLPYYTVKIMLLKERQSHILIIQLYINTKLNEIFLLELRSLKNVATWQLLNLS